MKKFMLITSLVGAMTASAMVQAAGGTINFQGKILDATCNSTVSSSGTVVLPTIGAADFTGLTAGTTPFSINLSGCTGTGLNTVSAYFESTGSSVVDAAGHLANDISVASGGADGVSLQIKDSIGAIKVGDNSQQAGNKYVAPVSGSAVLDYQVEYYKAGTVTAGDVASHVVYSLQYQ